MLFCLVVKEFWRRYKLGVLVWTLGAIGIAALWVTGLLWHFENECRFRLRPVRANPIVLCSLLIGGGMAVDARRPRKAV